MIKKPTITNKNYDLHHGDNLETLKTYPDNHFDSIVTDPPYGIDFLGKAWDKDTGSVDLYKECLRVLKPGGYILAFSAARTYHQLAYSIEKAGFEIRDQLMWLYSSGFPKAQDIGKAIQKRLGVEETIERTDLMGSGVGLDNWSTNLTVGIDKQYAEIPKQTVCTSPEALQWEGYKTALKPAHEPIVMARKPFKGSTIDNVLKNGLGAMNIDATRVPWADAYDEKHNEDIRLGQDFSTGTGGIQEYANIGVKIERKKKKKKSDGYDIRIYKENQNNVSRDTENNDIEYGEYEIKEAPAAGRYPSNVIGEVADGYQKYFYCPKVSRKERHSGFEIPPALTGHIKGCYAEDGSRMAVGMDAAEGYRGNNHPTVKPVALMDYLIKLVTPPSTETLQRKVLDPFMGSGSTGMAVTKLGHHFTGCDLDANYIKIADTRITAWNAPKAETNPLPEDLFGEQD